MFWSWIIFFMVGVKMTKKFKKVVRHQDSFFLAILVSLLPASLFWHVLFNIERIPSINSYLLGIFITLFYVWSFSFIKMLVEEVEVHWEEIK